MSSCREISPQINDIHAQIGKMFYGSSRERRPPSEHDTRDLSITDINIPTLMSTISREHRCSLRGESIEIQDASIQIFNEQCFERGFERIPTPRLR